MHCSAVALEFDESDDVGQLRSLTISGEMPLSSPKKHVSYATPVSLMAMSCAAPVTPALQNGAHSALAAHAAWAPRLASCASPSKDCVVCADHKSARQNKKTKIKKKTQ